MSVNLLSQKFFAGLLAALGFSSCCHHYGPPALYGPPVDDSIPVDTRERALYGTKTRAYMSPDEIQQQDKDSLPEQQE